MSRVENAPHLCYPSLMSTARIDPATEHAVRLFLARIAGAWPVTGARLYGSRARGDFDADSDADVAVFLKGARGERSKAVIEMAGIAFEVMLETNILVSPMPLWEEEWAKPEAWSNPRLLENIEREGIVL